MRVISVFALLLASCAAERGDDRVPSLADAGEDQRQEPADAGPDIAKESASDSGAAPDRAFDLEWPDPDALVRWDYTGEPFSINIYDARGPDGSCLILPGPWIATDPDSGLAYCLYPEPHPICDCIWERFFPDGGYVH